MQQLTVSREDPAECVGQLKGPSAVLKSTLFAAWVDVTFGAGNVTAGQSVTINGSGFSTTANQNVVRIGKLDATKAVFVDLKRRTVVVEARDGQQLDAKAITAEIVDSGYDVVKLEPIQKSVEEFKAEMKARK